MEQKTCCRCHQPILAGQRTERVVKGGGGFRTVANAPIRIRTAHGIGEPCLHEKMQAKFDAETLAAWETVRAVLLAAGVPEIEVSARITGASGGAA